MELAKFVEKFIEGFESHIQDLADGNGSKLVNLRDEYKQKALSYYDEIVDAGATVTNDDLVNCIEIQAEKVGF